MKSKILIIIAIIVMAALWFYLRRDPQPSLVRESASIIKPEAEASNFSNELPMSVEKASELVQKSESTRKQLEQLFEPPVEFYGQVLDQNDIPIVGAKVKCSWSYMGPMYSPRNLVSAAPDGRFEVKDLNAMTIHISLEEALGYQRIPESSRDILIAEPLEKIRVSEEYKKLPPEAKVFIENTGLAMPGRGPAYKPDKAKPVIFRLKKLGMTDALYYKNQDEEHKQRYGAVHYFSLKGRSTGTMERPLEDHCIGCIFTLNQAERDANKTDWKSNKQWSWSFRIQVPGGGIQVVPGDHNSSQAEEIFKDNETAPEGGYQAEIFLDFPKTMDETRWQKRTNAGYFIRFKDGTFARATISANDEFMSIESYYNPSGSRNLIFEYSKRIKD